MTTITSRDSQIFLSGEDGHSVLLCTGVSQLPHNVLQLHKGLGDLLLQQWLCVQWPNVFEISGGCGRAQ